MKFGADTGWRPGPAAGRAAQHAEERSTGSVARSCGHGASCPTPIGPSPLRVVCRPLPLGQGSRSLSFTARALLIRRPARQSTKIRPRSCNPSARSPAACIAAMISSKVGGSAGYRCPLLRGGAPGESSTALRASDAGRRYAAASLMRCVFPRTRVDAPILAPQELRPSDVRRPRLSDCYPRESDTQAATRDMLVGRPKQGCFPGRRVHRVSWFLTFKWVTTVWWLIGQHASSVWADVADLRMRAWCGSRARWS